MVTKRWDDNDLVWHDDNMRRPPKAPPVQHTYWEEKIADAEECGYLTGYRDATHANQLKIMIASVVGISLGILISYLI